MKKIVLHAWVLTKIKDEYYLPYTHWVYLNQIVNYYDKIFLLAPVIKKDTEKFSEMKVISNFTNVDVYELPPSTTYISAVRYFYSYFKAYKSFSNDFFDSYVRYPVPFGWLAKIFIKGKRIIHYVGDPIDTILKNKDMYFFRKILYLIFFLPEYILYLWASNGDNLSVFTNGNHIAKKIKKYGVEPRALISTTLDKNDFYLNPDKKISDVSPRLIYVGYLRKAKGVLLLVQVFERILKKYPSAIFDIVGSGELENELKEYIIKNNLRNINFHGHIDDRAHLNGLLRASDIFCFASLSEGSPRVILEAMANGINVVSTPVGSLPSFFKEDIEIVFSDFNDFIDFEEKIISLVEDEKFASNLRTSAFEKVSSLTIDHFIGSIFDES